MRREAARSARPNAIEGAISGAMHLLCAASWPAFGARNRHLLKAILSERAMGFEPTTCSLGSCHSTTELCPQSVAIVSVSDRDRQATTLTASLRFGVTRFALSPSESPRILLRSEKTRPPAGSFAFKDAGAEHGASGPEPWLRNIAFRPIFMGFSAIHCAHSGHDSGGARLGFGACPSSIRRRAHPRR